MQFESPWTLSLLVVLPLLLYLKRAGRGAGAVNFSSVLSAFEAGRSLRQRLLWLPTLLQLAAVACIIVALAGPQAGSEHTSETRQGIAVEMVLDISSSMDISMRLDDRNGSRLEVAKEVFEDFVTGDGRNLDGRSDDLLGMITFARYADTVCPLTLGHDALIQFVRDVKIEDRAGEDGTAIGDALTLAAARLQTVEQIAKQQTEDAEVEEEDYEIKSKVIILLTDGENNCGTHLPEEAGALAKQWDIRVHVIAFGDDKDMVLVNTPTGPTLVPDSLGSDAKTLLETAHTTGGLFRTASDARSLRDVYREIDDMEKSEIKMRGHITFNDIYHYFAAAAAILLALDLLLRSTLLRKIP